VIRVGLWHRHEGYYSECFGLYNLSFWGGYHGYFSDPDGYHWEVMYWENWQFNQDGGLKVE
jgi:hypothetical protein